VIEAALFCTVTSSPVARTSAAGRRWLSIGVRAGFGDAAQFAWLSVFGDDVPALERLSVGARLYVEGALSVREYEKAGERRHSINVACSYCRPAQIGRQKPKPPSEARRWPAEHAAPIETASTLDDDLLF
jgi:single-stranded DNA-binding protein